MLDISEMSLNFWYVFIYMYGYACCLSETYFYKGNYRIMCEKKPQLLLG